MLPNNRFDNVSAEKRAEIERDLMSQYVERMDAEASKTAAQLEAEKLNAELETISTTLKDQYLHYDQNETQIKAGEARVSEIVSQLQSLGAEKAVDARTQAGITFVGGQDNVIDISNLLPTR